VVDAAAMAQSQGTIDWFRFDDPLVQDAKCRLAAAHPGMVFSMV